MSSFATRGAPSRGSGGPRACFVSKRGTRRGSRWANRAVNRERKRVERTLLRSRIRTKKRCRSDEQPCTLGGQGSMKALQRMLHGSASGGSASGAELKRAAGGKNEKPMGNLASINGPKADEWSSGRTRERRQRGPDSARGPSAQPQSLELYGTPIAKPAWGHLRRRGRVGRSEAQEAREEQASTTIEKNWPVSAALALRSLFHSESSCRDLWALPSRLRASALAPASDERAGLTESSASS